MTSLLDLRPHRPAGSKPPRPCSVPVVPRLLFEGFTGQDYMKLFQRSAERQRLADTVAEGIQVGRPAVAGGERWVWWAGRRETVGVVHN